MKIVTELVNPSNISFLLNNEDYSLMKHLDNTIDTPLFASGEIYFSSVMDRLLCQAYYNPSIITIMNQLLGAD